LESICLTSISLWTVASPRGVFKKHRITTRQSFDTIYLSYCILQQNINWAKNIKEGGFDIRLIIYRFSWFSSPFLFFFYWKVGGFEVFFSREYVKHKKNFSFTSEYFLYLGIINQTSDHLFKGLKFIYFNIKYDMILNFFYDTPSPN
jgi:hypothetical protein